MLRRTFPRDDTEAKAFGGFMYDQNIFCRHFDCSISNLDAINNINEFLFDNGFTKIDIEDFDEELKFQNSILSISKDGNSNKLVLYIQNAKSISELDDVINKLIAFRDEREWNQFHNSKDLALAISIEAAELLELFLWKKEEDFNEDMLKDELADVLSFCFLLAQKHSLNIPEIVNNKITKNALKYPVAKAKGTASKYTDL